VRCSDHSRLVCHTSISTPFVESLSLSRLIFSSRRIGAWTGRSFRRLSHHLATSFNCTGLLRYYSTIRHQFRSRPLGLDRLSSKPTLTIVITTSKRKKNVADYFFGSPENFIFVPSLERSITTSYFHSVWVILYERSIGNDWKC
jgi:hypothetical protein